jgi:hypothetical protein
MNNAFHFVDTNECNGIKIEKTQHDIVALELFIWFESKNTFCVITFFHCERKENEIKNSHGVITQMISSSYINTSISS